MKHFYILAAIAASVIAAPINPYDPHLQHPAQHAGKTHDIACPIPVRPYIPLLQRENPARQFPLAGPPINPYDRPRRPQQQQYHHLAQHQPAYAGHVSSASDPLIAAFINPYDPHLQHPRRPRNTPRQHAGHVPSPLYSRYHPYADSQRPRRPPRQFPLAQHASHLPSGHTHEQPVDSPHQQHLPTAQHQLYPQPPQALAGPHAPPGDPYSPQRPGSPQQQQHHGHTTPGQEQTLAELQPAYPLGQGDAGPSHLTALNPGPPAAPKDIAKIAMCREKHNQAAETWQSSITANMKAIAKIEKASKKSNIASYWAPKMLGRQNSLAKSQTKFEEHTAAAASGTTGLGRIDESIQSGIAERIAANKVIAKIKSGEWY